MCSVVKISDGGYYIVGGINGWFEKSNINLLAELIVLACTDVSLTKLMQGIYKNKN